MKQKNEISLTVSELIASDNFKELKRLLAQMPLIDIAETFSELEREGNDAGVPIAAEGYGCRRFHGNGFGYAGIPEYQI